MTLMPVTSIWVRDSRVSKAGASRWIDQRVVMSRESSGTSSGLPRAFHTWPLVTSPTGTMIGLPVSVTGAPRVTPSVGCMEIARTRLSPMWAATSSVTTEVSPASSRVSVRALKIAGIVSGLNSTSMTGPMTRTTRPGEPAEAFTGVSRVAVMASVTPC